ncbi:MAG TPA: EamA/RhaT family transporter [Flavobacteriales bacterium]|nr:EamA/RhaT family transporter [Flavobacteriales bacterium]HIN40097.1 EamA/RhaT family transporter [Flavobacteriales bacterium]
MIYLLLSIVSSTLIFLIFKQFGKYEIDNFQAIVFNYILAALISFFLIDVDVDLGTMFNESWFIVAIITGVMFITMFNLMAVTTQKIGVAVTSVASKVSLIIPVFLAVFLYGDEMTPTKIIGIAIAVLSVFLTFYSGEKSFKLGRLWILPVVLFLGTGLLDTIMKYSQSALLSEEDFNTFSSVLFFEAALIGLVILVFKRLVYGSKIKKKNIIAGFTLGLPNYGSIFFLLQTLEHGNMESSVVFPLNNMSIVVLSAVLAFVFFKEKLSGINWIGIFSSIIAIAIISFA